MYMKPKNLRKFKCASENWKYLKSFEPRKKLGTRIFLRLNLGFLRSFEPEPEKSHSYKKEYTVLCCTLL